MSRGRCVTTPAHGALITPPAVPAATTEANRFMSEFHPGFVLNALVYAVLGILIFVLAFIIMDKLTPYDLWKGIVEEKNVALAILVGAMSIGIGIIIASAVH